LNIFTKKQKNIKINKIIKHKDGGMSFKIEIADEKFVYIRGWQGNIKNYQKQFIDIWEKAHCTT
jgi:hypothetical protein